MNSLRQCLCFISKQKETILQGKNRVKLRRRVRQDVRRRSKRRKKKEERRKKKKERRRKDEIEEKEAPARKMYRNAI